MLLHSARRISLRHPRSAGRLRRADGRLKDNSSHRCNSSAAASVSHRTVSSRPKCLTPRDQSGAIFVKLDDSCLRWCRSLHAMSPANHNSFSKKVLQLFPKPCTSAQVDALSPCVHNARKDNRATVELKPARRGGPPAVGRKNSSTPESAVSRGHKLRLVPRQGFVLP